MELTPEYLGFVTEIKNQIKQAQHTALKQVNIALMQLYWGIGKRITEEQEKYSWGKAIVEKLALDIQKELPGTQGYSANNLWRMRKFYLKYRENAKLAQLVQEIGWGHNITIMEKCNDDQEREFYIKMTKKYGWSKHVLVHQIEGNSYQRFLTGQTNFDKALEEQYKDQASLAIKDEYVFDFLELSEEYKERDLELGLIKNIRKFLMEMGGDFTFVGNQHRLKVGEQEFFIDLLLYHRRLRSLIAIELKITEFKPEYAGKMQFYLTALNEQEKIEGENPSIGIIICKSKDRTIVEYALNDSNQPIGVATYSLQHELPEEMKQYLPTAEEIAKRLEILEE